MNSEKRVLPSSKWTKEFYNKQLSMLKPMWSKKLAQYRRYALGQKDKETLNDLKTIQRIIENIDIRSTKC